MFITFIGNIYILCIGTKYISFKDKSYSIKIMQLLNVILTSGYLHIKNKKSNLIEQSITYVEFILDKSIILNLYLSI